MLRRDELQYSNTLIQKMFEADRRTIHSDAHIQLDPIYGTLLARFYKRSLLEHAFEAIPKALLPSVVAPDHAIIYYEAWKLLTGLNFYLMKYIIMNQQPVLELCKKNFRYERSTRVIMANGYYNDFIRTKTHLRKTSTGKMTCDKLLLSSSLLLSVKAPAISLDYTSNGCVKDILLALI